MKPKQGRPLVQQEANHQHHRSASLQNRMSYEPDAAVQEALTLATFEVPYSFSLYQALSQRAHGPFGLLRSSCLQDHFDLQDLISTLSDKPITNSIQDPGRMCPLPASHAPSSQPSS
jgi:hypothetical protein